MKICGRCGVSRMWKRRRGRTWEMRSSTFWETTRSSSSCETMKEERESIDRQIETQSYSAQRGVSARRKTRFAGTDLTALAPT